MKTIIYGLLDPTTKELRYVGKTVQAPKRRLKAHINAAKKTKDQSHRARWMRKLLEIEQVPDLIVIEVLDDGTDWEAREIYWIQYYRERGANLTNITNGGGGTSGWACRPETKEKLRQKARERIANDPGHLESLRVLAARASEAATVKRNNDPEYREFRKSIGAKSQAEIRRRREDPDYNAAYLGTKRGTAAGMREAKKAHGRPPAKITPEHREKLLLGQRNMSEASKLQHSQRISIAKQNISQETREKMRAAKLGKKLTPEHRAKLSAAQRERHTK